MGTALQILIALLVVIILLFVALFAYNRDAIAQAKAAMTTKKPKQIVPLVGGYFDANSISNELIRDIPFSVNQLGGAEFTYSFWVWKDDEEQVYTGAPASVSTYDGGIKTAEDSLNNTFGKVNENRTADSGIHKRDIVLFLKGDNKVYEYGSLCYTSAMKNQKMSKKDVMIKAPLIKFDRGTDRLTVEMNTYTNPDVVQSNTPESICVDNSDGQWATKNRYKFTVENLNDVNYNKKWFHVCVVVRDSNATGLNPIRNKINVKIFINGELKLDSYADGSFSESVESMSILRQNRFPLQILPTVSDASSSSASTWKPMSKNKLLLGGANYYNYAIPNEDVAILFRTKFNAIAARGSEEPVSLDYSSIIMNSSTGVSNST